MNLLMLMFALGFVFCLYRTETGNSSFVSALDYIPMGGIAWFFIVPGISISVLLCALLRTWVALEMDTSGLILGWTIKPENKGPEKLTKPPSDLSAAALSVLNYRMVTGRTLAAIVVEMYERGILRFTPVAKGLKFPWQSGQEEQFDYRLQVRRQPEFGWERVLCDSLLDKEVSPKRFKKKLIRKRSVIGKQLENYLTDRGFLDSKILKTCHWLYLLRWLAILLMCCGLAALVAATVAMVSDPQTTNQVTVEFIFFTTFTLVFVVPIFTFSLWSDRNWSKVIDRVVPNDEGEKELGHWWAFRKHILRQDPPVKEEDRSKPYPYLSSAIALGCVKSWMYSGISETLFNDPDHNASDAVKLSDAGGTPLIRPGDGFFLGLIAGDLLTGADGLSVTDLDLDLDFDLDI